MIEGYKPIRYIDLKDGMVVIYETKHYDPKNGHPVTSDYYRTIVGHHRAVSGDLFHLTSEPNFEWPAIPVWYGRWIYASNGGTGQMWVKEDGDEKTD